MRTNVGSELLLVYDCLKVNARAHARCSTEWLLVDDPLSALVLPALGVRPPIPQRPTLPQPHLPEWTSSGRQLRQFTRPLAVERVPRSPGQARRVRFTLKARPAQGPHRLSVQPPRWRRPARSARGYRGLLELFCGLVQELCGVKACPASLRETTIF